MDQLRLCRSVTIEGRDIWGRRSSLMLSPNPDNTGWLWRIGNKHVVVAPEIMKRERRRVVLAHDGHELNEVEHLGMLRAAGLHHVIISASRTKAWIPYGGGVRNLWNEVSPHLVKDGILTPYRPQGGAMQAAQSDGSRYSLYTQDGNSRRTLSMTGVVHFPSIDAEIYRFGFEYGKDDLAPILRARTLGWPPWVQGIARKLRHIGTFPLIDRKWPHYTSILWPDGIPADVLEEIGRHRIQDALGMLNFIAPTGTYLAGEFHTVKGSHETDLKVLVALAPKKVVAMHRLTA